MQVKVWTVEQLDHSAGGADVLIWDLGTAARTAGTMVTSLAPLLTARDFLIRPGGHVIPSTIRLYGMLVESECLRRRNRVDAVLRLTDTDLLSLTLLSFCPGPALFLLLWCGSPHATL